MRPALKASRADSKVRSASCAAGESSTRVSSCSSGGRASATAGPRSRAGFRVRRMRAAVSMRSDLGAPEPPGRRHRRLEMRLAEQLVECRNRVPAAGEEREPREGQQHPGEPEVLPAALGIEEPVFHVHQSGQQGIEEAYEREHAERYGGPIDEEPGAR